MHEYSGLVKFRFFQTQKIEHRLRLRKNIEVCQFKKISTQTSKTGLAGLWKPCGNISDTSARPPPKKMNTASASEKIELGQTLW